MGMHIVLDEIASKELRESPKWAMNNPPQRVNPSPPNTIHSVEE
jgi:hypothetical protein